MGGLLILLSLVVSVLLWSDLSNVRLVWIVLGLTVPATACWASSTTTSKVKQGRQRGHLARGHEARVADGSWPSLVGPGDLHRPGFRQPSWPCPSSRTSRPTWAGPLRPAGHLHHRRGQQRGESHRWPRRPGHRARHDHGSHLPASSPTPPGTRNIAEYLAIKYVPGSGPAGDLLRRAGGRRPRLSCGSTLRPRISSWATWAPWRSEGPSEPSPC